MKLNQKYNFCTLFDSVYLSRGLALYYSLETYCENFHLYIFAFDDLSIQILNGLDLKSATIISLSEFEDARLIQVKPKRTKAEYCWTCTSSTILYCLEKFNVDNCTYLDADLYFFSSPQSIFDEIGDASIALTEHHYSKKYDQSTTSGKYCVQFVFFRNNDEGLNALNWWRDSCIEWCYARLENGKFGDQKYLDDWTTRFNNVHIIENFGAGVAPWNVQQYNFSNAKEYFITLFNNVSNKKFNLIFYHFHKLQFAIKNSTIVEIEPSNFDLSHNVLQKFYVPYIDKLLIIEQSIKFIETPKKYTFLFKNKSIITELYLSIRHILKKYKIFQTFNNFLIKSSRP